MSAVDKLHASEFMPHAPVEIGGRVRINHESCPAGVDRKRRLSIARKNRCVVAYCHHCSRSGARAIPVRERHHSSSPVHPTPPPPEALSVPMPGTAVPIMNLLSVQKGNPPLELHKFLHPYMSTIFGRPVTGMWNVLYDPEGKSLYVRTSMDTLANYQKRNLSPNYHGPRYLSNGTPTFIVFSSGIRPGSDVALVICEDWISAMILGSITNTIGVCVFGSNPTDAVTAQLSYLIPRWVGGKIAVVSVFFDDDNAVVRRHSGQLRKALAMLLPGIEVLRISRGIDPKHHTLEQLKGIVAAILVIPGKGGTPE